MVHRHWTGLAAAVCLALAACGGGETAGPGVTTSTSSSAGNGTAAGERVRALAVVSAKAALAAAVLDKPASFDEAARFASQASFGLNDALLARLNQIGYSAWIDEQFALPATSHRLTWEAKDAAIRLADPNPNADDEQVLESFWQQAVTGPDQLRQRVAYALSQIFVISMVDGNVGNEPRAVAAWLDMLGDKGLGNYRQLLESVSLHPMMGLYLSHLRNQKANARTGRVPDENYGREVMQLFSIGLVQLNADGSPRLDANGRPIDSYGPADISGMARVFTGFSWACPAHPNNSCFYSGSSNNVSDPDRSFKPMLGYPQFHSTEEKHFLGVTIAPQAVADPAASLRVALDTLHAHPSVGPFIGRQLIQRLVMSNPSPAYIAAVAAAFANNGAGVRGDMKAVIKAVLLNPEARRLSSTSAKVREPVLRLAAYLRAFPHRSDTGNWRVGTTDAVASSLGQTPLRAPSVFNFYRPGYVSPNSLSGAAGLVAPELQLVHETSTAGYVNYMRDNVASGVGQYNGTVGGVVFNRRDIQPDFSAELALASNANALVSRVVSKLISGYVTRSLAATVAGAVSSITIPAPNGNNQAQIDNAKRARVNAAVLLVLASPEFQVQK
ncbi:MAG: DUF1800 family protein [Rubrivivax sp.]|nr:DUF1800 family protein [Rubrivivax sp.]